MGISFIHAADLHLDSPFRGLTDIPKHIFEEVRLSTFRAFDQLVQTAITKQVDFVLFVGDLFDHETQSLKAQVHLRNGFEKLQNHRINVYLCYGNHDFIQGNQFKVTYPDNVFIFPNETISSFIFEKDGLPQVKISGFSYESQAVTDKKIIDYPFRDTQIPYHIGMLHGSLHGDTEHDTYAPFRLQQLQEKAYDYWALGHIHQRVQLMDEPPAIYPGNTQGRHRKETGEKGCYYVQLAESTTKTIFIPLQSIQFDEILVNVANIDTFEAMEKHIYEQLTQKDCPTLTHLTLEGIRSQHLTSEIIKESVDIFNEQLVEQTPWQYIYQVRFEDETELPAFHPVFVNELKQAFENIVVQKEIGDLANNTKARRFLELPPEKELVAGASKLLAELFQIKEVE